MATYGWCANLGPRRPMYSNLDHFRRFFLNQKDSYLRAKEGVPLYLLDALTPQELAVAETELLRAVGSTDPWPIQGLGHIRSQVALPKLHERLPQAERSMRIYLAHAIYRISADPAMIDLVLESARRLDWPRELRIMYLLPDFKDPRIEQMLESLCEHKEYLVAWNATRALGLSTEDLEQRSRGRAIIKIALEDLAHGNVDVGFPIRLVSATPRKITIAIDDYRSKLWRLKDVKGKRIAHGNMFHRDRKELTFSLEADTELSQVVLHVELRNAPKSND